jgi:hypothetical protein
MKVQVTQTLVFTTNIEVPDEIAVTRDKLQDYWVKNPVSIPSIDDLEWVGTHFSDPDTGAELGDI